MFLFIYLNFIVIDVYVYSVCAHMPQHTCGGQRITFVSPFTFHFTWHDQGIETQVIRLGQKRSLPTEPSLQPLLLLHPELSESFSESHPLNLEVLSSVLL